MHPGDDTRLLSNDLPSMFPNQNNKVMITVWAQPTSSMIPPFKFESRGETSDINVEL